MQRVRPMLLLRKDVEAPVSKFLPRASAPLVSVDDMYQFAVKPPMALRFV